MNRALAAAGIAALSTTFGAAYAAPANKQIVIATTQEFETLNPLIMQMSASQYLGYMVDRPLVVVDGKWNYACELCVTLPSLENGLAKVIEKDGKKKITVDWEIKPGLVWNDGTPLTGADFVLAWEIGRSPNVSVGSKETYDRIESWTVDAKNPKKMTTVFTEARYDFYQLSVNPLPAHLEAPVWAKTKDQVGGYEKLSVYTTDPTNKGLYNGPYDVTELRLGSHAILTKSKAFKSAKGEASIERIIFKLIPNTQTLEAALMAGDIDMVGELGFSFDQAVSFEKRVNADPALKAKFKVVFRDGLTYEHVDFNLRNPALADVRVRKAISYAIDKKKLTDALFAGKQLPALSNIHPLDMYYTDKVASYPIDAKKAAALLDEAGWKLGAGGMRFKDGQKLELPIMSTADNKTRELVEQYIQAELKKIGISVPIKNEPARVFFGETTKKALYPAMAMYAWTSAPDSPPRSTLHSKEIPTAANGFSGQNSGGWSNKKVDDALEKIFLEFDFNKRKALMAEVQQIYTEEVPVLPLYLRATIAVVPASMKNFELSGHQFYSTLDVETWKIEAVASH